MTEYKLVVVGGTFKLRCYLISYFCRPFLVRSLRRFYLMPSGNCCLFYFFSWRCWKERFDYTVDSKPVSSLVTNNLFYVNRNNCFLPSFNGRSSSIVCLSSYMLTSPQNTVFGNRRSLSNITLKLSLVTFPIALIS